jgi:hypothetical protein
MSPDRAETLDFSVMHIKSNVTKIVGNLRLHEYSIIFMRVRIVRLDGLFVNYYRRKMWAQDLNQIRLIIISYIKNHFIIVNLILPIEGSQKMNQDIAFNPLAIPYYLLLPSNLLFIILRHSISYIVIFASFIISLYLPTRYLRSGSKVAALSITFANSSAGI